MFLTFRLLVVAGWLAVTCAACTPKPSPAPVPPGYLENPY